MIQKTEVYVCPGGAKEEQADRALAWFLADLLGCSFSTGLVIVEKRQQVRDLLDAFEGELEGVVTTPVVFAEPTLTALEEPDGDID